MALSRKQNPKVEWLIKASALAEDLINYEELEAYAERRRRMAEEEKCWDLVTIENAKCVFESDRGGLKVLVDGDEHWIPKKLVDDDTSEVWKKGTEGKLVIPEWLAVEKGLV